MAQKKWQGGAVTRGAGATPDGVSVLALRDNLVGSPLEFISRFALTGAGVLTVAWLIRDLYLLFWLSAFGVLQIAMYHYLLTRRSDARRAEYVAALVFCGLNGVTYLALPAYLWAGGTTLDQFSAIFLVMGYAIYALTRDGTVRVLAVINAVPLVMIVLYMAHDFASVNLPMINVAIPVLMTLIILSYYLLGLRETFVTRRSLRQTEARVLAAERLEAVGRLTGGVAHDFNNILTAVLGHLELHDALRDPQEKAASLRAAHDAATRAARLTAQLLFFARKARLQATPTDPCAYITDLANRLRVILPVEVTLRTSLPKNMPDILVDRGHLETVLLHLILNARESMADRGEIRLALDATNETAPRRMQGGTQLEPGRYCVIRIEDDGAGIASHHLDRVFEPFYSTKSKGASSGLGMSMAAGFADQSGGALAVQSRPGFGTQVMLFLPALSGQ